MPARKTTYKASTFDSDAFVTILNREVRGFCEAHPETKADDGKALLNLLLRRSGVFAYQGASKLEGGPFGALVVDFNTKDHIPNIVGFGTNHVVPTNDPSAHAEMTAIRDASVRLGQTDFSGLILVTSCECCPMCLSAATGCKVDKIYFAATRDDAAGVGFSDADQYRLMRAGGIERHANKVGAGEAETLLNGHDAAVVVMHEGKAHVSYGNYGTATLHDPTDLPSVQAIKRACAGLASLTKQNTFHLPEDTRLISRDQPHPMSLVVADWARIGRRRGADASDPAQDTPDKNTSRILYTNDRPERMEIRNMHGANHVDPEHIWREIRNPTSIHVTSNLGRAHRVAFDEWKRLIDSNFMPRY